MNKYFVETDFLFGLRHSDRYNSKVEETLKLAKNKNVELKVITSAIFEVRTVLYSQGKNSEEVRKILTLMKQKLDDNNIREEFIKLDDFILADYLRSQHEKLTFFDALHAAVSQRRKISLYGNDEVLKTLKFISKSFDDELV
jgi:PIN domain nuclease of toxin-antitoxin system